jgi:hypothetical protein
MVQKHLAGKREVEGLRHVRKDTLGEILSFAL